MVRVSQWDHFRRFCPQMSGHTSMNLSYVTLSFRASAQSDKSLVLGLFPSIYLALFVK